MLKGTIIRGVGGFYDIHTPDDLIYRCRAKGIFRKLNIKPLVGDEVGFSVTDEADMEGSIDEIYERKSQLLRPAVANVDQALIIFSLRSPVPNLNLLDTFLVHMHMQKLPCIICFNKMDLVLPGEEQEEAFRELSDSYEKAGYKVILSSSLDGLGLSLLKDSLVGHITTVAGPSGVGKSSLINALQSNRVMETGDISRKIERGRHTTRHSELIYIGEGSYIMDTPGFTSLRMPTMELTELAGAYREFAPYEEGCRFNGCSHSHEPGCAVKGAVERGELSPLRYNYYLKLQGDLTLKKNYVKRF